MTVIHNSYVIFTCLTYIVATIATYCERDKKPIFDHSPGERLVLKMFMVFIPIVQFVTCYYCILSIVEYYQRNKKKNDL